MAALRKLGSMCQLNSSYNLLEHKKVKTRGSGYYGLARDETLSSASSPSGSPQKLSKLSKAKSMNFGNILGSFADGIRWPASLMRSDTDEWASHSPHSLGYETPKKHRSLRDRMSSSRSRSSKKSFWGSKDRRAAMEAYERGQNRSPVPEIKASPIKKTAGTLKIQISIESLDQSVAELSMGSGGIESPSLPSKAVVGPQLLWPDRLSRSQDTNDPYVESSNSLFGVEVADFSDDSLRAIHDSKVLHDGEDAQNCSYFSATRPRQGELSRQIIHNVAFDAVDDRRSLPSYHDLISSPERNIAQSEDLEIAKSGPSMSVSPRLRRTLSRRSGLRYVDVLVIVNQSGHVLDDEALPSDGDTAYERSISGSPLVEPSMGSRVSWESTRADRAKRYAHIAVSDEEQPPFSQSYSEGSENSKQSSFPDEVDMNETTSFHTQDDDPDCRISAVKGINEDLDHTVLESALNQDKGLESAIADNVYGYEQQPAPPANADEMKMRNEASNLGKRFDDLHAQMKSLRLSTESVATLVGSESSTTSQENNVSIFLGELECHSSEINPRSGHLHFSIAEQTPSAPRNQTLKATPLDDTAERSECCILTSEIGLHNCGCYPSQYSTDFIQHTDDDQCCDRTQQSGNHTCGCHPAATGDYGPSSPTAPATDVSSGELNSSNPAPESEISAYQRFITRYEADMNKENMATRGGKKEPQELRGEARGRRRGRRRV